MNGHPMIIAHRGASCDAPENTMAAIKLAWGQNADALEVDIHLTRDGQLVVIHDADTGRTGNSNKNIADYPFDKLEKIDMGSWKGAQWSGKRIPTLWEVFQSVPLDKKIFVEIKGGAACLPPLKELIEQNIISPRQIVLMDFDLQVVLLAKKTFPHIVVLWLYEFDPGSASDLRKQALINILKIAVEHRLDGLNIENIDEFDNSYIKKVKELNLRIFCWTVNRPERAAYLLSAGIDGVTTDRPGWLRESLNHINLKQIINR